jgi:hypothetical protein
MGEDRFVYLISLVDRHHEGSINLSVNSLHIIKVLKERWAAVPCAILGSFLDIGTSETRYWHPCNISLGVVASSLQEWVELGDNLIVSVRDDMNKFLKRYNWDYILHLFTFPYPT